MALGAVVGAWGAGPASALAAPPHEPSASPDPAGTEAKAAIGRAREAVRAKDYARALLHYEEALRLLPSAKLHFNIGVCHHRLMASQEPGSPAYEAERSAAVTAYNHYLQADPSAPDTDEVAAMIRALGGTPLVDDPEPWTIELVEPDDVPAAPSFADDESSGWSDGSDAASEAPAIAPPVVPPVAPTPVYRGRFGVFVPVVSVNPRQLAASEELRPLPTLGLGLRGSAFLGPRRRVALGGELALGTQPVSARARHRLGTSWAGVLIEVRHPLRDGRFEIGGGGVVGLGSQGLVYTGNDRLRCAVGREASRRNGLWSGVRLYAAALLGRRRNHELSLRVGPGLAAFAGGTVARMDPDESSCEGEPSAFATLGLREGAALSATVDIGYAPRF